MTSRDEKLKKLKSTKQAGGLVVMTDGTEFVKALQAKIDELRKALSVDVSVNADDLIAQLEQLDNLRPTIDGLRKAIADIQLPDIPDSVELRGLDQLVAALANHSAKLAALPSMELPEARVKVDVQQIGQDGVDELVGRLDDVVKAVKANKADQTPDGFVPVRRVMKIGNVLVFDDHPHNIGGGGGGGLSQDVTRLTGTAIAVVNPDGSNISGGSGSGGAVVDGADSSIKASVLDYTNSNPLAVRLTDTNGDYIAAGAGTQYTEDDAAAANPVGGVNMLVRADTPATIVTTDGDNVAQRGTNYGAAYVQILDGANKASVDTSGVDGESNTSSRLNVRAMLSGYNGTTWDRLRSTTANGLAVDVTRVQGTVTVDGSGVTQPISATALPLPALAATSTKQSDGSQKTQVVDGSGNVVGATSNALDINIKSGNITGFATAAKQPALGTAGTASADVITVQGIASMTPIKVDGSAVTQPVSGAITATPEKASSASLANVSTSTSNATLLSSNASRKKAVIVNDGAAVMYVKYGTTASATSYSYLLQPYDTLEETNYTGRIDGILASGTGTARTTEL